MNAPAPRPYEERYRDPEDVEIEQDFEALLDRLRKRGLTAPEIADWIQESLVQWKGWPDE